MTFYTIMYICAFFRYAKRWHSTWHRNVCTLPGTVYFITAYMFCLVDRLGRQNRCQHTSASDHYFGDVLSCWTALSVMHSVDKDSLLFQLQSSTVVIEKHKISSPISRTIHFRYRSMGDFGWNPLFFSLWFNVVTIKSEIYYFFPLIENQLHI